jgi:hypothetical protein
MTRMRMLIRATESKKNRRRRKKRRNHGQRGAPTRWIQDDLRLHGVVENGRARA